MCWVTAGRGDAGIPMYNEEVCHGTQVMNIHEQNEFFGLIVAFEVNKSLEVNN